MWRPPHRIYALAALLSSSQHQIEKAPGVPVLRLLRLGEAELKTERFTRLLAERFSPRDVLQGESVNCRGVVAQGCGGIPLKVQGNFRRGQHGSREDWKFLEEVREVSGLQENIMQAGYDSVLRCCGID